ncbi:MAG TPA: hypothetical protein VHN79_03035 [Lacunisphaera sp.]|nr:hypothetical protein [Lacunisphaera sp.]HEX2900465.1 hypothetical protein [Bacteroidia bacterium]
MTTKSIAQDRKRISAQRHEVTYAGKQVGRNGTQRVLAAKKTLGRSTSRAKVMAKARA